MYVRTNDQVYVSSWWLLMALHTTYKSSCYKGCGIRHQGKSDKYLLRIFIGLSLSHTHFRDLALPLYAFVWEKDVCVRRFARAYNNIYKVNIILFQCNILFFFFFFFFWGGVPFSHSVSVVGELNGVVVPPVVMVPGGSNQALSGWQVQGGCCQQIDEVRHG